MKCMSLACILALSTSCALPTIDAMARYGQLNADGDFGAAASGMPLVQNDLSDVGIEDNDGHPSLRVDLDVGAPHFVFSGLQSSFDGDGTLSQDITLDGNTITVGTTVDTEFDLGIYSGLALFDLFPGGTVDLSLGLGVTALDVDLNIQDTMSANSVASDETLPIPVLAAQVGGTFGRFEVAGLLSGISANVSDADVTYLDADGFVRYALFRPSSRGRGSLVLGYRWIKLDAEYDDGAEVVKLDSTFSGPYLGFQLHF